MIQIKLVGTPIYFPYSELIYLSATVHVLYPKKNMNINLLMVFLGGLVVSVLAIGHKVRGFKPCRGR
jgi:hypothetical protein